MNKSEAGKLGGIATAVITRERYRASRDAYDKNPKLCLACNEPISFKDRLWNVYCSSSCSASTNNRLRRREQTCLYCGKKFGYRTALSAYCSVKCHKQMEWEIRKRNAISSDNLKNRNTAKRFLFEEFGIKCVICGLTEWCGQVIPLVCDHIDGNSDNWSISNCRMICCNCDAQTPTYKGKNKGNGRHSRRIRYREGKSY